MAFSRATIISLFVAGWIVMITAVFAVMFSGHVLPEYGAPGRALAFSMSFLVLAVLFYLANFVSAASVLFFGRDSRRITDFRASGIVVLVMAVVFIAVSPVRFFITTGALTGLDGPLVLAGFLVFVVLMNSLLVHSLHGRVIEAAAFSIVSICGAVAIIFVWMKSILGAFDRHMGLALAIAVVAFGFVGVCLFKIASSYYGMSASLLDMIQSRRQPLCRDVSSVSEDILVDERQQSRQEECLEERLEERLIDGEGL